jgi:hypothetical protein
MSPRIRERNLFAYERRPLGWDQRGVKEATTGCMHIVPQRDAIEATGVGEPDGLPLEREDRAGAAQTLELVLATGLQMKARAVQ